MPKYPLHQFGLVGYLEGTHTNDILAHKQLVDEGQKERLKLYTSSRPAGMTVARFPAS